MPVGRLDSLRLSGAELRDVELALAERPAGVKLDGLLGVNVLDRFRATLEFRHATLVLRPYDGR